MHWILDIGHIIFAKYNGTITEAQFNNCIAGAKTTTGYFMGYRPRDVAKAFVKAQNKLEEISSKVAYREELK